MTPLLIWILIIAAAAAAMILLVRFGRRFVARHPAGSDVVNRLFLVATPLLLYLMIESSLGFSPAKSPFYLFVNLEVYVLLTVFFANLPKIRGRSWLSLLYILTCIAGLAFGYVDKFRGYTMMPSDLLSIRTGLEVADQYGYTPTPGIVLTIIIMCIALMWLLIYYPAKRRDSDAKSTLKKLAVSLCAIGLFVGIQTTFDYESAFSMDANEWWPTDTYRTYGVALGFLTYAQKMEIEKPEGYTRAAADELIAGTEAVGMGSDVKPTVIVVMNEAFSNMEVLGPLNQGDILSNLKSMEKDPGTVEYGYSYVSTIGGGTSITEYEFLTGNSKAASPRIIPYMSLNFSGIPNLAETMEGYGYRTIAMHPALDVNWKRNIVYRNMGFDEFLSIDDYKGYDLYPRWDIVSDQGDYEKLVDVYESLEEPAFLFNVTIQNHGGYATQEFLDAGITLVDEIEDFQDDSAQAYLSTLRDSDDALGWLLNYFRNADQPVLLCFFGDHQPGLSSTFYDSLKADGETNDDSVLSLEEKSYAVPYFIWTNFDVEPLDKAANDGMNYLSENWLGNHVLYYATGELTDRNAFLRHVEERIPILNLLGYKGDDGNWHEFDEETEYSDLIQDYQYVEYRCIKDNKGL